MVTADSMSTEFIEPKPTTQTVYLSGVPVNLSAISRTLEVNQGYLSRIFAGKATPSIPLARKLSGVLGLGLEEFLKAIEKPSK